MIKKISLDLNQTGQIYLEELKKEYEKIFGYEMNTSDIIRAAIATAHGTLCNKKTD